MGILGQHVSKYMEALLEDDEEAYKKQFSSFLKNGITADGVEPMYRNAHSAIRADPLRAAKRLSIQQRKARVAQKKAAFIAAHAENAANAPAEEEEEEMDEYLSSEDHREARRSCWSSSTEGPVDSHR